MLQVQSILKSYRWAPFLPVALDNSMLSVLLLLSKYRLRNVPVIEPGKPDIKNYITQSAVVQGLERCRGRDWFDCIAARPISDLGLPFMSCNEVSICYGCLRFVDFFNFNCSFSFWSGYKHPEQRVNTGSFQANER